MRKRDISNNNEPIKIYKRVGSKKQKQESSIITEENCYIPKHILPYKEKIENRLSMALLNPRYNSIQINKFQRILENINLMIENKTPRGEFL